MFKIHQKTILAICFSFLIVLASLLSMQYFKGTKIDKTTIFLSSRIAIWIALLLVFIYSKYIEKQQFLLWNETKFKLLDYIISIFIIFSSLFALMLVFAIIMALIKYKPETDEIDKLILIFKNNIYLVLFTCITAGITEELVFRGYLLPRLTLVFNSPKLGIIISSLLFGLLHYGYGNLAQIIGPMLIGTIFAIHYYYFRNLKVLIFCHFLWDFILLMVKIHVKIPT
jgi:uncharacterized protein